MNLPGTYSTVVIEMRPFIPEKISHVVRARVPYVLVVVCL